jgi:hypothetical protein
MLVVPSDLCTSKKNPSAYTSLSLLAFMLVADICWLIVLLLVIGTEGLLLDGYVVLGLFACVLLLARAMA